MECPKCHSVIPNDQTVCPTCHKVVLLECPNCKSLSENAVCTKCGYNILVKCSKCSKLSPIKSKYCSKCGLSLVTSLAYQECESDEFASIVVSFGSLNSIRRLLKSSELYSKFIYKLNNLLNAQIKGIECKMIRYENSYVINLHKELSFATSSNKAVRLALKIINAFVELNSNIIEELATPLNLKLSILKKKPEELLEKPVIESNIKLLTIKKNEKRYLNGFQVVLDQDVRDLVNKDYKTDSLFSTEIEGRTVMFYEVILDSYVLPPEKSSNENTMKVLPQSLANKDNETSEKDAYSFKVFDINAKCSFERYTTQGVLENLSSMDLDAKGKIVSIRKSQDVLISPLSIAEVYSNRGYKVLNVSCTQEMNYQPWGFFRTLFQEYFNLSYIPAFNDLASVNPNAQKLFKPLFELLYNKPLKAMTPEDARFAYMELWNKFLAILSKTVIIVDGFEYIDDTSLQTLELYFDKFKNVKPNFVFITENNTSVHSKIKGLLRTSLYSEFTLQKSTMEQCLAILKSDAVDFIQSFYFEKIKENFKGSTVYFANAIQYLKDSGVIVDFENKLIVKTKKSVIIPKDLNGLLRARIKTLSSKPEQSFILAYMSMLGSRIDFKTLEQLGIKDVEKNCKALAESGFARIEEGVLYLDNYGVLAPVITASLKKDAENYIAKNIIAKLGKGLEDTATALIMGRLCAYKEEYLTLWKNSQFAIKTGDYDAYLKNCLGFLTLVEHIEANIPSEAIEENKKDVYNNILACLYSYSPAKIYFIENILLMDAINEGDDDKIVKLSNLMLQGALISSNYTDAMGLLHNILSRMQNATLIVNGEVNTKFLLLSLVSIEILYNVGNYSQCVETMNEILEVLTPETINVVKPPSFSTNLFVSHVMDTCRLAAMAKLYTLDDDLEEFFEKVQKSLNTELPEKDAIVAVKDFLKEKAYVSGNVEEYSAYSKVIFLILQELSVLKDDYNRFAQNIYQAKLLSVDIHQQELEMFCDLLIAYAYYKIGVVDKAEIICIDVMETAQKSAMFNIINIARYLLALLKQKNFPNESLLFINDSLAMLRKYNNQSKILYALFEKLYIEISAEQNLASVDLESEEQKLLPLKESLKHILG